MPSAPLTHCRVFMLVHRRRPDGDSRLLLRPRLVPLSRWQHHAAPSEDVQVHTHTHTHTHSFTHSFTHSHTHTAHTLSLTAHTRTHTARTPSRTPSLLGRFLPNSSSATQAFAIPGLTYSRCVQPSCAACHALWFHPSSPCLCFHSKASAFHLASVTPHAVIVLM